MNEFKVGLLTLFAIASIVSISLKITSNQSGFGDYTPYQTVISDAAGIFPRTPIKVAGINAGRITKIDLAGNQAVIHFEILDEVPITKNSVLRIKTIGFLGDKYLEIYLGEGKEKLPPGTLIVSESSGGLEDLTKDASEVLRDLKTIMKSIKDSIVPYGKESPIQVVLSNVTEITRDIKAITTSLRSVISKNEEKLNSIIDNLEQTMANIEMQVDPNNPDGLMSDLNKIGPVLDNAKEMTNDLKLIIADVKAGRGTVGRLLRDDQVIDQVSQALSGVQKIVNKVDSIQTELSMFTAISSEASNKSDLALAIYPSPERFYLLGITTSEVGLKDESEIRRNENGGPTLVEHRTEIKKNTFLFNVQIGRRIQNWSFRIGLIESTGGFGIDYFIPRISSYFTFELFDYDKDLGPNLRLMAQIHFWNVFYGKIGGEDLLSKNDEQSAMVGAGLRFTDEDLKGLIGFLL